MEAGGMAGWTKLHTQNGGVATIVECHPPNFLQAGNRLEQTSVISRWYRLVLYYTSQGVSVY
jgi:hypothetical protein